MEMIIHRFTAVLNWQFCTDVNISYSTATSTSYATSLMALFIPPQSSLPL